MKFRTLALVVCLLLAGCAAPAENPGRRGSDASGSPSTDRLGWENGYWANQSIAVDQSDGLNASEREALVGRTMARVELIRGLEFRKSVPVEVISRRQYRNRSGGGGTNGSESAYARWNDQVWEAALLVGEDRSVDDVFGDVYGGSVQGYYSPGKDRIVIVSDSETPTIDRSTLAHELVHALQDQHFEPFGGQSTQDAQLASNGLTEGDANYVEALYDDRCGTQWDCLARPSGGGGGSIDPRDLGVFLAIYFPYSDGPQFVHEVRGRGGWDAVDAAYENPPASTEQVIHPRKYPDDAPSTVRVPDRSASNWKRFDVSPTYDTLGEATLFVTFWYQQAIDRSELGQEQAPYSQYNYDDPITRGWDGDRVVPYHTDGGATGYVWRLRWDTERDARQFADAYRGLLTENLNATTVRDGVYRVPDSSPYGDAFRVTRDGKTVTIVNAPTPRQLSKVHAES